jgi:hypothetical protein
MDPSPLDAYSLDYWLLAQRSDVVLARTEKVGPAPRAWSGFELAHQVVAVQILATITAQPREGALRLEVPVIEGAVTAAAQPGLAPFWASPGGEALLFLAPGADRLADAELGALPASDVDRLRALMAGPIPVSIESVAYRFAARASESPAAVSAFDAVGPCNCDLADDEGVRARLTFYQGGFRSFHGRYLGRRTAQKAPDLRLLASAHDLGAALAGDAPAARLASEPTARHLAIARALDGAAAALSPEARRAIREAAG